MGTPKKVPPNIGKSPSLVQEAGHAFTTHWSWQSPAGTGQGGRPLQSRPNKTVGNEVLRCAGRFVTLYVYIYIYMWDHGKTGQSVTVLTP